MAEGYPERMQRDFTAAIDVLFAAGRLGQKNQQGFYDYQTDKKGKPEKRPSETALALVKESMTGNLEITDEDIVARMMIPMATELARCLEEGIVETAAEADMALVYGTGFPPFRGGVLRWIDQLGAAKFCAMAEGFRDLGPLYLPPANLTDFAANNKKFYGWK
jgi:3-hydroxyacyl-CoA dehydrogenase/enoyl-CoA hydratase/3-hydroxybutyryl-CoA epimerase/enoyl-CoA isomerase